MCAWKSVSRALLLYCSMRFYLFAHRRNSLAFRMLALALALWGGLMAVGQLRSPLLRGSRKRRAHARPAAADAARHRHGHGVVRERAQCCAGKCACLLHPGRRSAPASLRRRPGPQHDGCARPPDQSAAHSQGCHLHRRAMARSSAFGAARILAGIHPEAREDGCGRVHRANSPTAAAASSLSATCPR